MSHTNSAAIASPAGIKGFDCNTPTDASSLRALHDLNHRFAVRYVGRREQAAHDISVDEVERIFSAGLALMLVQHVENESAWTPTAVKGTAYGAFAATTAHLLACPAGVTVWLDLEGVDTKTPPEDVIAYCNNWYDEVVKRGYQPGIYVGWHAGLNADTLYRRLKFARYWGAFNLNKDQEPAVRGLCMKQREATAAEAHAVKFPIDGNSIRADAKGGLPTLWAPDEWDGR